MTEEQLRAEIDKTIPHDSECAYILDSSNFHKDRPNAECDCLRSEIAGTLLRIIRQYTALCVAEAEHNGAITAARHLAHSGRNSPFNAYTRALESEIEGKGQPMPTAKLTPSLCGIEDIPAPEKQGEQDTLLALLTKMENNWPCQDSVPTNALYAAVTSQVAWAKIIREALPAHDALIQAAEREACAQMVKEKWAWAWKQPDPCGEVQKAIRSRSNTKEEPQT